MDNLLFWVFLILGILVFLFVSIFFGVFIVVISIFFLYRRKSQAVLVDGKGKKKVVTVIEGDETVEIVSD